MKKSGRFSSIVKIEEAKEREEARKFSASKRVAEEKRIKLAELEGFREEYKERFLGLTRNGAHAGQIRSCYSFIAQLNSAITQQQSRVMDAEQAADECRRRWLQAKQRMDALQKAMNKFRLEELRQERKREQIVTDEIARRKQQGI